MKKLEVITAAIFFAFFACCWTTLKPGGRNGSIEYEKWFEAKMVVQDNDQKNAIPALKGLLKIKNEKSYAFEISFYLVLAAFLYFIWRADVSRKLKVTILSVQFTLWLLTIIFGRIS